MPSPRIQFRAMGNMENQIGERTSLSEGLSDSQKETLLSGTAFRDLDRYYDMLVRSLPKFSMGEAMLMADVMNGTIHMPYSAPLLWAQVSDSLEDGYAEKWKVDGPALVTRLHKLTPFECMAVADALERAWNDSQGYRVNNMEERMRSVGLVKE
jgi:hypothetical protein